MDIEHLIDRLEKTLAEGKTIPLISRRLIDDRRVWPLLDQMRISIPEEVRRARRLNLEREKILAQAKEEAQRIIELARLEADKLSEEHAIVQSAENRATALRDQVRQELETMRAEADDYAYGVLCSLEEELQKALRVVENGLRKLQMEHQLDVPEPERGKTTSEP